MPLVPIRASQPPAAQFGYWSDSPLLISDFRSANFPALLVNLLRAARTNLSISFLLFINSNKMLYRDVMGMDGTASRGKEGATVLSAASQALIITLGVLKGLIWPPPCLLIGMIGWGPWCFFFFCFALHLSHYWQSKKMMGPTPSRGWKVREMALVKMTLKQLNERTVTVTDIRRFVIK